MSSIPVIINILIILLSLLVGLLLGNHLKPDAKFNKLPKIIVNTTSQIASVLVNIQEGTLRVEDQDKIGIINALFELLEEEHHPDADVLYYIATEVINNRHPSQIYEVWMTLAFRVLAVNPQGRLPHAWFVETIVDSKDNSDSTSSGDISEIMADVDDDHPTFETEAGPLITPNLSSNNLSLDTDELNTAYIYSPKSNLPAEVILPQHLDMCAVD